MQTHTLPQSIHSILDIAVHILSSFLKPPSTTGTATVWVDKTENVEGKISQNFLPPCI